MDAIAVDQFEVLDEEISPCVVYIRLGRFHDHPLFENTAPGIRAHLTLAGIFLKPEDATKLIFQDVARVTPGATDLLSEAVAEAFNNRSNAGLLALAGIALLAYSASGAFGTLDKAINRAWGTEKE